MPHPKVFLSLTGILLLTLLSVCCDRTPGNAKTLSPLPSDAVVLAFGDSITYGTGAGKSQGYPAQLSALTGLNVINAGVPGETTAGGRKRLPQVFAKTKPDLVILCLGGNDFLRRQDREQTVENLTEMLEWIQSQAVPVVLLAVPESFGLMGQLKPAALYGELADELNVPLQNTVLSEVLSDRSLKADPIHPNKAGYGVIAEAMQLFLQQQGALSP